MTSELDTQAPGPAERARNRRIYRQVGIMTAAALLAGGVRPLSKALGAPEALQVAATFLPLIPLAWGLVIAARFVLRSDEWERGVYLAAASVGFVTVMGAVAVLGLAQAAGSSSDSSAGRRSSSSGSSRSAR
jgi:hypothetical protein